ncbi:hypothetical protein [Sphingosinicella sp.]|uniref:hypothetical protein n=1 Tax=Sphingosinicella sp. TaxID=1917971 RepID=UPI0035B39A58
MVVTPSGDSGDPNQSQASLSKARDVATERLEASYRPDDANIKSSIDPAPPNWAVIVALAISIISLIKSFLTDRKSTNSKRGVAFEANYGTPIRHALRNLEKSISGLRQFSFPNPKDIPSLKRELEVMRTEWESAAQEVSFLLEEVDSNKCLVNGPWLKVFEVESRNAEIVIQSVSDIAVDTPTALQQKTRLAFDSYRNGIKKIRSLLDEQCASYDQLRKNRRK